MRHDQDSSINDYADDWSLSQDGSHVRFEGRLCEYDGALVRCPRHFRVQGPDGKDWAIPIHELNLRKWAEFAPQAFEGVFEPALS